ncbi:unnamed protein product [Phyllotreta striolata]|uniref:Uncharacterized protein n=1 Tax=Phyllotreta striolata TaxID=444603 RepID=A0A9N9TI03_PHYSR|nr:unnamed protein product [Phyllotreta striolata]
MLRNVILTTAVIVIVCTTLSLGKQQTSTKNHELLTKLGLQKIRGPNSHHKKRLAVESRHHSRSDDSHMFIVKLPPHPHYYVHNAQNSLDIHSKSRNLPVGFKNNGRPAKIYHWNLPLMQQLTAGRNVYSDKYPVVDFRQSQSWNDIIDKPPKEKKPKKPSYYVPSKPKKSKFTKYFPGNGKPHSFYVIENSKKGHYHKLLP